MHNYRTSLELGIRVEFSDDVGAKA